MSSHSHQSSRGSALVIILVVVGVIGIVGAVAYVLLSKNGGGVANIFGSTKTATSPGDIKSLLTEAKAGKFDAKCTYTTSGNDSADSAIYMSGAKRMRVDTPINGKPGHLVRIDNSAYLWADGESNGSKLPMNDKGDSGKYTPDEFSKKAKEYHMTCESVSSLSDSLFNLPSGVSFVDFNAQLQSSSYGN